MNQASDPQEQHMIIQDKLAKRRTEQEERLKVVTSALATMLASERVLARDWNTPEEDEAWADLSNSAEFCDFTPTDD